MIKPADFLTQAKARGYQLYTGVPCSYLRAFIDYVIDSDSLRYVAATNEGDAIAVAAGSELGGLRAVCMFQNSGLGNAVSPLSSLTATFKIPMLLIVTHRGEPGAPTDEPQHEMMGRVTPDMLELLGVPWERFPTEPDQVAPTLERADRWMADHSTPYALLMSSGSVEPWSRTESSPRPLGVPARVADRSAATSWRGEVLAALRSVARPTDVIVATTGYTGRELYSLGDHPGNLYVVGSMGCASSVGLGLAIARPRHRVIVIDGDGAALMRLGALATIGAEQPPNLVHVLLDNGQHESTGGQHTVTDVTDLAAVAAACGYPVVERATHPEQLARLVDGHTDATMFVHFPTHAGVPGKLPRPTISPPEVAQRLRSFLDAPVSDCGRTESGHDVASDDSSHATPHAHRTDRRRMRVLVVTDLDATALGVLQSHHDVEQSIDAGHDDLLRLVADCQVIVFRSGVQVSAEVMRAAPALELLVRAGSGLDNIDVDHAREQGIALARIPGPGARAVAELAFGLMLSLARQIPHADGLLRKGHWAKHHIEGHLLRGKTLGIYGAGNIGGQVGEMGMAWGMDVIGCVASPSDDRARELRSQGIELVSSDDVLRRADFLVLTLPLDSSTRYIIDADAIAAMRPGAFLINVARGGVVDEQALASAVRSGHLAGAGMDVHEREGEGALSPLAEFPNVLLTPHMGAGTVDSKRMIGEQVVRIVAEHAATAVR